MIPSGFYPTDVTTADQSLELTKRLYDIPITSENFSDAYWLGWINYDNLPSAFRIYKYEINDTVCTFTDVTAQKNYPVGYTCAYLTSTYMGATRTGFNTNNGTNWQRSTACSISGEASDLVRLPNNLDINTTGWNASIIIMLYGTASNGTATDNIMAAFATTDPTLTGSFQAYFGRKTGSFFNPVTLTLNFDDFADGVAEFSRDGIDYKIAMTNYEILYLRDIDTNNDPEYYAHPKTTILVEDDMGHQHLISSMTSPFLQKTTGYDWGSGEFYNGFYIESNGGIFNPMNGGCLFNVFDNEARGYGGLYGSFDLADINFVSIEVYFPENANFMIVCINRNDIGIILRYYKIDDIRKMLALTSRFSSVQSQRYENSTDYLYAHVSEDNEFLCELVDGSPASVQNELREWQIVGHTIVDNNFDPADIPPYEPYPGSDLEELGDDIDIQKPSIGVANNFLTMYALTEAQVSNFGSVLWTSWVEEVSPGEWSLTKMIDNFTAGFDLLTTTASFDISSVLQFIVSLRVYPFSLANLHITQNAGQVAYIGRGEYGINCGGGQNILKFTESMGYLNAGSLTVPRHFGDWRDHDNTTVMAYLPYCGTVELNPSDVVGRTLVCTYAVDVYTGQCMAIIESYSPEDVGGRHYPIAIASGTIGVSIPVSTTNSGQIAGAFINSAMNIMQIVSGAATDAAMQIAGAELAMNSKSMSKQSTAYQEAYAQQQAAGIATNLGNAGLGVENEALGYLSSKGVGFPTLSGGSGLTSFMEPSSAYIQIRRGLYKTNDQYDHTNGKPSTDARPLSSYIGTGLTICNNVDVSGLTCHEYEKAAIKEMLASGVYL